MGNYGIAVRIAARSFSLFRRMLLVMAFLSPANNAKGFLKLKFLAISGKKVLIYWEKSGKIKKNIVVCLCAYQIGFFPVLVGTFFFIFAEILENGPRKG